MTDQSAARIRGRLAAIGLGTDITGVTRLSGGVANTVWLVRRARGDQVVVKATEGAPDGLFAVEAEGLAVLRRRGGLRTPDVVGLGAGWLALEALDPALPDRPAFWEAAGHAVARLHEVRGERYGWHRDGWLGLLPQRNAWSDDGHAFFAEHRVLRYLDEPAAQQVLTAADRSALERLCARLPELVPPSPPALTHGDLWRNNIVSTPDGTPAFIDPAVSWMWPELDLSMMYGAGGGEPARFFEAYQERRPLEPGWRDRMPLLIVRELLCSIAHGDNVPACLDHLRQIIAPFRPQGTTLDG
jgi:fructosamine-3-kinase